MKKTLIYCLAIFAITSGLEAPRSTTKYGLVKGSWMSSRAGRKFSAFRGIPYAKPPKDELRFQSPQPPDHWDFLYSAENNAPACLQKNYLFGKPVEGSEDCLYINVYTHNLNQTSLMPVMVFIHWGGFFAGYGSSEYLGPEYIMDKNVLLVTFNYRLGVFGFLSTGDDSAPGNYGLKDQQAALKWVQENIHYFGGDKNRVTLFGQSAGGASVHYHMLNPKSQKLFHQAISESGSALSLWAKPVSREQSLQIATLQGTFVGCKDIFNATQSLLDCLRNADAEELVKTGDKFKFFSVDPLTVYLPSLEIRTENNSNPFITKDPIEYIKSGEFPRIPWILGTVKDEGIIRAAALTLQPKTLSLLNRDFNRNMPHLMALVMSTPKDKIEPTWKQIRHRYFGGINSVDVLNKKSVQGLIDLYTDRSFAYSVFQTALLHWKINQQKIWVYNFNYRGVNSYGSLFAGVKNASTYTLGVSHCDELLYLFRSPAIFPDLKNANDITASNILVGLWTNFAIYGDPTPNFRDTPREKWSTIKQNITGPELYDKNLLFLNITGNYKNSVHLEMDYGLYKDNFKFWEQLPLVENIAMLNQSHVDL